MKPEQTFNSQKVALKSKIEGRKSQQLFAADIVIYKNKEISIECKTSSKSKMILKWENKFYA